MAIKMDLCKAYDRVEWKYLIQVMKKKVSAKSGNNYHCISTATFQILLNGIPREKFGFTRGLRQGDPLSFIYSYYVRRVY